MNSTKIVIGFDIGLPYRNYVDVYNGILSVAEKQQWDYIFDPYFHPTKSKINSFQGAITRSEWKSLPKFSSKKPVVNVQHNSRWLQKIPTVVPDFVQAGRLAADHLISRGFRQFALFGYSRDRSQTEMDQGFREQLAKEGLGCEHFHHVSWLAHRTRDRWESFNVNLQKWLEEIPKPVGIFINRDVLAHYLINASKDLSFKIPEDMGIVCTESSNYLCADRHPTLTSIDLAFDQVGIEAGNFLNELMGGKKPKSLLRRVQPKGLVARQSTDFYAVNDELVQEIIQFLQRNYEQPIGMEEVANALNSTRRTIERHFSKTLNSTIGHELARIRIEKAKRLLVDTKLLVKQIAIKTGFVETRRLNENFRRLEGCLPSEYRSQWSL